MEALNAAILVNMLGFAVGIALYALLGAMVLRQRNSPLSEGVNSLLLATSGLGLLWNIGELFLFVQKDFGFEPLPPLITAVSYSALGFLPSVVVHSAQAESSERNWLTAVAYGLSTLAAILHFYSAAVDGKAPSDAALISLTVGSAALAAGLLIFNFRQTIEKKAIWSTALLIFAVSALHLSSGREENWAVELVAHQSSLPLAFAILYQNYRFAFADLFLKRAISLILLTLLAFALYALVAAPLLRYHETHDRNDAQAISLIILLWVATALAYPLLHRTAVWLVDKIILRRADYEVLQEEIAAAIDSAETPEEVLNAVNERLSRVLTAKVSSRSESAGALNIATHTPVQILPDAAVILVPTAEGPFYEISIGDFAGGRRLLSDERTMLEKAAFTAARRIDALRVTNERFEQEFREQEFEKLATEAQLTALRSQINPHFLFNALTTIGHLIQTGPDKAFRTLLQLTKLLRGVLSSGSELCTLDDELSLIENYLVIEKARFEERLLVEIDVPEELRRRYVPPLILQPLVENAIKHAVSQNRAGGRIGITARLDEDGSRMRLAVTDSGSGKAGDFADEGVGLRNIRERLAAYYDNGAELFVSSDAEGTRAELTIPPARIDPEVKI